MNHSAERNSACLMNHSEAQRRCTNDTQMIRPAEQQQSFHSKPPGSLPSCPRQRSVHVAASREMGELPGPISASSHPKMCVLDVRCHDISRTRRGNELRVLGLALGLLLVGLPRSAAILTGTAPANGPRTGGVTMTIRGAGFGGLSLPEVRLGSSVCTNTRWISDSIIITRIPSSGVQFQDNVILTMQTNAQHTLSDAFTFDQPVILGAGPANSPANANGVVTFRGMNFGAYDHSPRGRVGNTACVTTQWTSQSSIECKIPFGAHSLYLLHTASLAPPPSFLSSLLPCSSKHTSSPQAILCVLLARFFHPAYSFSISFSVLLLCCHFVFVAGTASGKGKSASLQLTVAASTSSRRIFTTTTVFTYDAPHVLVLKDDSGTRANGPATGGNTITATGLSFGTVDVSPSIFIGGTKSLGHIWTSDTSIAMIVAPGVQAEHPLAMSMDGFYGRGMTAAYDYDPPAITGLNGINGPATGRQTVTVLGKVWV